MHCHSESLSPVTAAASKRALRPVAAKELEENTEHGAQVHSSQEISKDEKESRHGSATRAETPVSSAVYGYSKENRSDAVLSSGLGCEKLLPTDSATCGRHFSYD